MGISYILSYILSYIPNDIGSCLPLPHFYVRPGLNGRIDAMGTVWTHFLLHLSSLSCLSSSKVGEGNRQHDQEMGVKSSRRSTMLPPLLSRLWSGLSSPPSASSLIINLEDLARAVKQGGKKSSWGNEGDSEGKG